MVYSDSGNALTLTASASAALQTFYLWIEGTSGDQSSVIAYPMSTTATLMPWFSVTPEFTYFVLPQGGSFTNSFTVTDENGFNGMAWLEPPSAPGISLNIQQTDPVTGSGVVNYTASSTAMPTLWSSSGYAYVGSQPIGSQQAPIFNWILVTPTVPFTLGAPSGPLSLVPGGSTSASISITPQNGFSGSAELNATGLPSGLTANFDSNPTVGNSKLKVNADASVPPGSYYVNISATAEGQTLIRTITLQVNGVPTTTALSINPSGGTLDAGASYTLTATVSPGSGSTVPTGNVVFTIGSVTQSEALNSSGVATYNGTAPATAGSLTLSAAYQGATQGTTFTGSTSNTLDETVVIPSFAVSGTTVNVAPGATSANTSTITVTASEGFTGSVTLTAKITSSPTGAAYPPTLSFGSTNPVNITGSNAGTATLTIYTTAATTGSLAHPVGRGVPWYAAGGATLACILLFGIPARRRSWRSVLGMVALLFTLIGGVLACGGGGSGSGGGGGGNPGTTAGAYTVTVTGTSGTTTATGSVTLTVQ